jgi:hypothetical protein
MRYRVEVPLVGALALELDAPGLFVATVAVDRLVDLLGEHSVPLTRVWQGRLDARMPPSHAVRIRAGRLDCLARIDGQSITIEEQ